MPTFQAERDALLAREKAHTHEGDAIAAARRRLPMVEVLRDPADRRSRWTGHAARCLRRPPQLIAYYHMWYPGNPAPEQ